MSLFSITTEDQLSYSDQSPLTLTLCMKRSMIELDIRWLNFVGATYSLTNLYRMGGIPKRSKRLFNSLHVEWIALLRKVRLILWHQNAMNEKSRLCIFFMQITTMTYFLGFSMDNFAIRIHSFINFMNKRWIMDAMDKLWVVKQRPNTELWLWM